MGKVWQPGDKDLHQVIGASGGKVTRAKQCLASDNGGST